VNAQDRARTYHRWQFALSLAGFGLSVLYLVALLATGAAVGIRNRVAAITPLWWLEVVLAGLVFGAGYRIVSLPLRWVSAFWLPRRFGLLHQSLSSWLWDAAKASAIGAVLALLGVEVVYGSLRATPWWWLWSGLLFLAGYALLALVAPVWLVPLFYRLVPLGDEALARRLTALAARVGVPVLGVWIADQSRKSRTANAAVAGLGRTRRILLFDTLVSEFTPDEVESVLAHELGHQVHGDIRRGLLFQGAVTLATFWIADHALRLGAHALGLSGPTDVAGLPLFGLILIGVGLIALPVSNGWSRHVERQADDFAIRTTGNAEAFIAAMQRLARLNLAEEEPHRWKEFLFYSHPSISRRVARARAAIRQLS
jgi:STE24 endopeptidase